MTPARDPLAALIAQLAAWGVRYLRGGATGEVVTSPAWDLFQSLADCPEPRVSTSIVSLLLLHPELATTAEALLRAAPSAAVREAIAVLTLATLYEQRCWQTVLTLALGRPSSVPEAPFRREWERRGLPAPAVLAGHAGLRQLERYQIVRTGLPLAFRGDWDNHIAHLCRQEVRDHPERAATIAVVAPWREEKMTMSLRPPVGKDDIEAFFQALGRLVVHSAQVYVTGGAALIHLGVRTGETEDIDISGVLAGDEQEIIAAVRSLSPRYNVEFAAPANFIPLPGLRQPRFVGRYGNVEIFYDDFVTIALSKLARGQERDFRDILLLLRGGVISLAQLTTGAEEIAPQLDQGWPGRVTGAQVLQRLAVVARTLAAPEA